MTDKNLDYSFSTSIKNALFCGISASVLITAIWFMTTPIKRVAFAIFFTGGALFYIKALVTSLLNEKGIRINVVGKCIFIFCDILVFLFICVYTLSPTLLFHPNHEEEAYRSLISPANTEELLFSGNDGMISGWQIHSGVKNAPLVLYFGGSGECSSRTVLQLLDNGTYDQIFKGYDFAFLDYPSYGKSEGSPSEKSFRSFGLNVYDYFSNVQATKEIYIFGAGLGTGVANYVASKREISGLVLFAPYKNGYDLYNNNLRIFRGPFRALAQYKMNSIEFAGNITVKPLIFAAENDETIPYASSYSLASYYNEKPDFVTIGFLEQDTLRNRFFDNEEVLSTLHSYLQEVQ